MLVLSRKKNESIVINNDIVVTVVEIRGDKVRLGIVAPKEVPVHRQEVYDAIHGKDGGESSSPPPVVVNKPADEAPRALGAAGRSPGVRRARLCPDRTGSRGRPTASGCPAYPAPPPAVGRSMPYFFTFVISVSR